MEIEQVQLGMRVKYVGLMNEQIKRWVPIPFGTIVGGIDYPFGESGFAYTKIAWDTSIAIWEPLGNVELMQTSDMALPQEELCAWCQRACLRRDMMEVASEIEISEGVSIASSVDYVCSTCIEALPEVTLEELSDWIFEDQLI
jgi:hypothetical protein